MFNKCFDILQFHFEYLFCLSYEKYMPNLKIFDQINLNFRFNYLILMNNIFISEIIKTKELKLKALNISLL
jgi:hypothetical protein